MRFGKSAPTATEVAASGDFAGSGEDNDPKSAICQTEEEANPAVGPGWRLLAHDTLCAWASSPAPRPAVARIVGPFADDELAFRMAHDPAHGSQIAAPPCLRMSRRRNVTPPAGWSGAANFPVRAVPWPSNMTEQHGRVTSPGTMAE